MQRAPLAGEISLLAALARDLIGRQPGERIPTVIEYQEQLGIGSGTVQARLRTLESIGAIELRARGHRGTVLVGRNLANLWTLGQVGPISGVLPLPEAFEPVSLAATLRRAFQQIGIPVELMYLHGSAGRVDLVREGRAHFTVLSEPAAATATDTDHARWLSRDLGPESYHRESSIVVLVGPGVSDDAIVRVGIDPDSPDHALLTRLEFPPEQGYLLRPHRHTRLPAAVAQGQIDAAVWLRTALAIPLSAVGIVSRSLRVPAAVEANRALSRARLIAQLDNLPVAGVLRALDVSGVRSVQEEILASDVLPLY
jgi:YhfZ C-terminal domain/Helix-turn-helix domain